MHCTFSNIFKIKNKKCMKCEKFGEHTVIILRKAWTLRSLEAQN